MALSDEAAKEGLSVGGLVGSQEPAVLLSQAAAKHHSQTLQPTARGSPKIESGCSSTKGNNNCAATAGWDDEGMSDGQSDGHSDAGGDSESDSGSAADSGVDIGDDGDSDAPQTDNSQQQEPLQAAQEMYSPTHSPTPSLSNSLASTVLDSGSAPPPILVDSDEGIVIESDSE